MIEAAALARAETGMLASIFRAIAWMSHIAASCLSSAAFS